MNIKEREREKLLLNVSHLQHPSCVNSIKWIWHQSQDLEDLRGGIPIGLRLSTKTLHFVGYMWWHTTAKWRCHKNVKEELEKLNQFNYYAKQFHAWATKLKHFLKLMKLGMQKELTKASNCTKNKFICKPTKYFFKSMTSMWVSKHVVTIKYVSNCITKFLKGVKKNCHPI